MPGPDLVLWMPWALLLSAVTAGLAVRSMRRGQSLNALRWAGWAFVPPALLLTGTLRLAGRVSTAVLNWSAALAFNPLMWSGVVLAGIAVVLLGTARVLQARRPSVEQPSPAKPLRSGSHRAPATREADDDLADIEEILRRRGIS